MSVQGDTVISIKHVSKSFSGKKVLDDINIDIRKGEFVTFLGPSGCGKTTTLRMIAGFCPPDSGDIFINGKDMKDVPPYERQLNTVFQRYALFPHLDVYDNVAFGLKLNKVPETEINKRVKRILKMVSMSDYEDRSVDTLSGGQQQRIAIARALVNQPDVLLLDEPLAALDLKMRKDMQIELKEMHKKLGITFIYVTHDQEEALTLSDTIVVMNDGRIQQTGAPIDIYNEPVNSFVADFIGESNILNGVMIKDKLVSFIGQEFKCVDEGFGENTPVDIVVRPEDVQLRSNVEKTQFYGTITSCTFKGVYYQLFIQTDSGFELMAQDFRPFEPGTRTGLSIRPENIQVMHKERLLNEFEGEVVSPGVVSFLGADFECETGDLEAGTKVFAKVEFSKIDLMDDIEQGNISGAMKFIIYKGDHYHVEIATESGEKVYADTNDVWDKNDLVGIRIAKEDIVISKAW